MVRLEDQIFATQVTFAEQNEPSLREPRLHHKLGVFGAGLAAVDGGFGAPLGGEAAHSLVYVFVEAQQVADYYGRSRWARLGSASAR